MKLTNAPCIRHFQYPYFIYNCMYKKKYKTTDDCHTNRVRHLSALHTQGLSSVMAEVSSVRPHHGRSE